MNPQAPICMEANPGDIKVLNEISIAAKMYWDYPKEWLERWRDDLQLSESDFQSQRIFKLLVHSQIAGFCAMKEEDDYYEVSHLWLKPEFIGQGLGSFLLTESLAKVVTRLKPIWVTADPNAEKFYSKQGFKTISQEASYPPGRFLPRMRKIVAS